MLSSFQSSAADRLRLLCRLLYVGVGVVCQSNVMRVNGVEPVTEDQCRTTSRVVMNVELNAIYVDGRKTRQACVTLLHAGREGQRRAIRPTGMQ